MWGLGTNSAWLPKRQLWATVLICINARCPRLDMRICIILEPLVLTNVIPRLRVVLSMKCRFNVKFLCQGHGYALKVNEFQIWRHDRRRRRSTINMSNYQDFVRIL